MSDFEIHIWNVHRSSPQSVVLAGEIGVECAQARYDTLCLAVRAARERRQLLLYFVWTDVIGPSRFEVEPLNTTCIEIHGPGMKASTDFDGADVGTLFHPSS